jgi:putative flavoprotein involved in K+ transport
MPDPVLDVAVIGAGQAGLGISYFLTHLGVRHIVFERGRIGETWRTQRWASFVMNSPNRFNTLPGDAYAGANPDGFDPAGSFVSYLEDYASRFQLPVQENARVVSVESVHPGYRVTAHIDGRARQYTCRQVVAASGAMNEPKIPPFAKEISPHIRQYHAGEYRTPADLPDGAVLVVGSAQSGLQVAEELIEAGKRVYLSTSAVGRVPRRYRGKDIFDWLLRVGFFDLRTDEVTDPRELELKQPLVSGVGPLGHTHSLQSLARRGAVIIGKIDRIRGDRVDFQPNAPDHIRFGDDVSRRIKGMIDGFIAAQGLDSPPPEADPADEPDLNATCASSMRTLDLDAEHIRSVVWATGFAADFSYLKDGLVYRNGKPQHRNGIANIRGLYVLGLPWLRKRKSGIINGIEEDATFIAQNVEHARSHLA